MNLSKVAVATAALLAGMLAAQAQGQEVMRIAIPFPQRNLNIHVEGDANPQMLAALLSEEGDKAVVAHTGAATAEKEASKSEKPTEPKDKPGAKA